MRQFDLTPFYRSTVGFDRLFATLDWLVGGPDNGQTYPPYNIERTGENAYRVTLAVAGFAEEDLAIEAKENILTVKGEKKRDRRGGGEVLYRGIASRAFERRFQLADHVEVKGASLENGLLHIDLVREIPEALKPRKIAIANGAAKARPSRSSPRSPPNPATLSTTNEAPFGAPFFHFLAEQRRREAVDVLGRGAEARDQAHERLRPNRGRSSRRRLSTDQG